MGLKDRFREVEKGSPLFLDMIVKHRLIEKIKKYFALEQPVIAVYLFGSISKGKTKETSDIDLGLLMEENFDFLEHFDYKLRLIKDLEEITSRRVDVIFINKVDPILQYHIRKYGEIIFERDKGKRIEYEVLARKRYFDFQFRHKNYINAFIKNLHSDKA